MVWESKLRGMNHDLRFMGCSSYPGVAMGNPRMWRRWSSSWHHRMRNTSQGGHQHYRRFDRGHALPPSWAAITQQEDR
jgi:hypothetical protein